MEYKVLFTVFAAVFVAELGDKTQLATMLFAADKEVSKMTVFVGASLALIVASAIGVLAGKFSLEGLFEKVGINIEMLLRGENAGLLTSTRKFTDSERSQLRSYLEGIYNEFVTIVSENRGMEYDYIDSIAECMGLKWCRSI